MCLPSPFSTSPTHFENEMMRMSMRKPYPHFPFIDDYYRKKIEMSLERLKMFEPPEGYYLAFSGGKDSCVVKKLCDMAGVKYDAHYNNTTIDHPELVRFIKKEYPDVAEHKPKKAFLKELVYRGFPIRQSRWCCEYLKEGGGSNRTVLLGVRWEESAKRKNRKLVEHCMKGEHRIFVCPIIDWDDNEVWIFLKETNTPYCKLYDEGYTRLGCIFCPNVSPKKKREQAEKYPKYVNAFKIAFRKLYADRKARGLTSVDRWKDGDEMFEWWLNG